MLNVQLCPNRLQCQTQPPNWPLQSQILHMCCIQQCTVSVQYQVDLTLGQGTLPSCVFGCVSYGFPDQSTLRVLSGFALFMWDRSRPKHGWTPALPGFAPICFCRSSPALSQPSSLHRLDRDRFSPPPAAAAPPCSLPVGTRAATHPQGRAGYLGCPVRK